MIYTFSLWMLTLLSFDQNGDLQITNAGSYKTQRECIAAGEKLTSSSSTFECMDRSFTTGR
jgi:hypothetical protein